MRVFWKMTPEGRAGVWLDLANFFRQGGEHSAADAAIRLMKRELAYQPETTTEPPQAA